MNRQRLGDGADVVLGGIADVQPPDGPGAFGLVEEVGEVRFEVVVPSSRGDEILGLGGVEGEAGHDYCML